MTITNSAIGTPIPNPNEVFPFVDLQTGILSDHGVQFLKNWRDFIVGMNRLTPCSASGTNIITLTPNNEFPIIEKYIDYEIYSFVAANTSTGNVTATVVPRNGVLATLKAYKTSGAAQATTGDVVAGSLYLAVYNDALDSGNGGFVLK